MLSQQALTFLTVAEQGSFSKAGQLQFISPVSVMKQMNAFENEVGVQLLTRSKLGVKLTPAGRVLYTDLSQINLDTQKILKRVRRLGQEHLIPIRVGTSVLRPCSPLVELWSQIAAQQFNFQIEIVPISDDEDHFKNTLQLLGSQVDCIVSPYGVNQIENNYQIQPLGQYPCMIAVPNQHHLARQARLTWSDLTNENILLLKKGSSNIIDQIRSEINSQHPSLNIHDLDSFYNLTSFNTSVQNNYLMEVITPWNHVHPSLTTLPMEWNYQIPYGIISAKESTVDVQKFIEASLSLQNQQSTR